MIEIITGIQLIKMYAWENAFERLITEIRRLELNAILKNAYIHAFNLTLSLVFNRIPLFCTILSFVLLYGSENLTVSKMFMTMYIINGISFLMCHIFVRGVSEMGEILIALKRLQVFLEYEEKDEFIKIGSKPISNNECDSMNLAILMHDVSSEWCTADLGHMYCSKSKNAKDKLNSNEDDAKINPPRMKPFALQGINLKISKGTLTVVIGPVGSGKSTLLNVLLRELPLSGGSIGINGKVSYANRESWIFDSTIRQNIIFGLPMDQSRYDRIVRCTDLWQDFKQFENGDLSLVGENGACLSGGQKSRIKYQNTNRPKYIC